jgi:hypothetical protein
VLATPERMNDRIAVQKGHFLCNLHSVEPFEISLFRMLVRPAPVDRPVVLKFIVSRERLGMFVSQLQRRRLIRTRYFLGRILHGHSHKT